MPTSQTVCMHLSDAEVDAVSAGFVSVNVSPSLAVAPSVNVGTQLNLGQQLAFATISSANIMQFLVQSNEA